MTSSKKIKGSVRISDDFLHPHVPHPYIEKIHVLVSTWINLCEKCMHSKLHNCVVTASRKPRIDSCETAMIADIVVRCESALMRKCTSPLTVRASISTNFSFYYSRNDRPKEGCVMGVPFVAPKRYFRKKLSAADNDSSIVVMMMRLRE